jgi:hypothetical protein
MVWLVDTYYYIGGRRFFFKQAMPYRLFGLYQARKTAANDPAQHLVQSLNTLPTL